MSWWENSPVIGQPLPQTNLPDRPDFWADAPVLSAATTQGGPIVDQPMRGASPLTAARASLAPDPQDQIRRFAAARFPNLPLDEAVRRYGVVDGNIVYADEKGQYVREIPSVTGASGPFDALVRLAPWLASQAGPAIPAVAGAGAGALAGPTGTSIPVAGLAAGGADVARQALDRALAGEPLDIDYLNAAGQGALAGAGQAVGMGLAKSFSRDALGVAAMDRAAAMSPQLQAETGRLVEEANRRGIPLSAGQATGLRSVQQTERQLGRRPETADMMADFYRRQQGEAVPTAFEAELNRIAIDQGAEANIRAFRQGASDIVNQATEELSRKASGAYSKALDDKTPYIDDKIGELMQRPVMKQALKQAVTNAQNRGIDPRQFGVTQFNEAGDPVIGAVPSWRAYDYIKRSLDDVISSNKDPRTGRLMEAGAAAQDAKKQLLGILDKVNPEYKQARSVYGEGAEVVDGLLEGGVGLLKKLSGPERQNMVSTVFNGRNLLPEEISRMRGQFEMSGHLEDWNLGLRQYLSGILDDAMRPMRSSAQTKNTAGVLYQTIWGDPKQRKAVEAALGDPQKVAGLKSLMDVLSAASRVLPEGSPTATDMGAMDVIMRGTPMLARLAGKATSPETYLNFGNEIVQGVANLRAPGNNVKLAEAILSGQADKQLRQLRLLPPLGEKALATTAQVLTVAGVGGGAREMTAPPTKLPQMR